MIDRSVPPPVVGFVADRGVATALWVILGVLLGLGAALSFRRVRTASTAGLARGLLVALALIVGSSAALVERDIDDETSSSLVADVEESAASAMPGTAAGAGVEMSAVQALEILATEARTRLDTRAPDDDVNGEGAVATNSYTVASGDDFWTVAERLSIDAGLGDSDGAVWRVWQDLMLQNADRLVEPGNPDLLLPGQVLDLAGLPRAPG